MSRTKIPDQIRQLVLERDGYTCRYCGASGPLVKLHLDHVYPESRGGETSIDNLVTSCSGCNSRKSARVGIWPNPVRGAVRPSPVPMILTGTAFLVVSLSLPLVTDRVAAIAILIAGVLVSVVGLAFNVGWKHRSRQ